MSNLSIFGNRFYGQDVRNNNIQAVQALANIVKNSFGPQGLDKMLIDDLGEVTVTNDGATILKMIEVEHPAAKVIVELSQLQEKEVGDGTTSVVILAAELLKRANDLINLKIHPTQIIQGYRRAMKEACKYMEDNLSVKVSELGKDVLINLAKTSMSSKIIGMGFENLFAEMVVDGLNLIKQQVSQNSHSYLIKNINIVKCHGKSSADSQLIKGYILRTQRSSQQMPTKIDNPKIACLDFNLSKFRMNLGVQFVMNDPKNLKKIRERECNILKERLEKIINAGANVILTTKGIDEIANNYLVESKCIGLRRVPKQDLRRISKLTGATIVTTIANTKGDEVFESSNLGFASQVQEQAIGDNDFIFIRGPKLSKAATLLIRGPNEMMLDEIERCLHDSLNVVKRAMESGQVVAGGGAVESALGIYLEDFSKTFGSKEQIPFFQFSEALQIIPKTLANNASLDNNELISKLRVYHHASQYTDDPKKKQLKYCGLDLQKGKCRNCLKDGVVEPLDSKIKCLKFATEAAITILRIDDFIKIQGQEEDLIQKK